MQKIIYIVIASILFSCSEKKTPVVTPWGTQISEDASDVTISKDSFNMDDILQNGEMIMLTISGPETYYDYHGRGMGLNYLLLEQFAQHIGVSLRVELCKDSTEMKKRLMNNEADIIAYPMGKTEKGLISCGVSTTKGKAGWLLTANNTQLASSIRSWFNEGIIQRTKKNESFMLSTGNVTRHVYSPMLNRSNGTISIYDESFKRHAPQAHIDWRLMAAQCYQESTFDPKAHSWAGACGLMQIMPTTADHLGLARTDIYNPELNIAAAAKYMRELMDHFSEIGNSTERYMFALASYNGGSRHIRDAMALTRKYGKNPHRWNDVSEFVLKLQNEQYYSDPCVKYGYMRGSETVDYVYRIRERWRQYKGCCPSASTEFHQPVKSKRKNKYKI